MLYTSKESLEHLEFRFRMKKYDILKKKTQILKFFRFWSKGGTLWCRSENFYFFWIFKIFGNFFEKWPQGVLGNVKRNKVMKYELIWSVRQGVTQDHRHVRVDCTPPCSIGLTFWFQQVRCLFFLNYQLFEKIVAYKRYWV